MSDQTYQGKTKAEWSAMQGGGTDYGENRQAIRAAVAYGWAFAERFAKPATL